MLLYRKYAFIWKAIYKVITHRCVDIYVTGSSAFLATKVTVLGSSGNIAFPMIYYNEGGDYNNTSGVFTCRVPGTYWFAAGIGMVNQASMSIECRVLHNNQIRLHMYFNTVNTNAGITSSVSGAFRLQHGDWVQVGQCYNADHIYSGDMTFFSGMLITPSVWGRYVLLESLSTKLKAKKI